MREQYRKFMAEQPCEACGGKRLRPESLAVLVDGKSISEITSLTVRAAIGADERRWSCPARPRPSPRACCARSPRASPSCSTSGSTTSPWTAPSPRSPAARRSASASPASSAASSPASCTCSTSPASGCTSATTCASSRRSCRLRDLGNTVLVVEHDEETIRAADHVVDFGPGAGHTGGKVIFSGTPAEMEASPDQHHRRLPVRPEAHRDARHAARAPRRDRGARAPASTTSATSTCASRSACSPPSPASAAPARARSSTASSCPASRACSTGEHRSRRRARCASPASAPSTRPSPSTRSPSAARRASNPGTYTKAFDLIRDVFAELPESRARGWGAGRFSFNVKGGRCENVQGRRRGQGRDALPRRRLRALRDVRRAALQRADAGCALQGEEHRRRAGVQRRRLPGALRGRSRRCGASWRRWSRWGSAT